MNRLPSLLLLSTAISTVVITGCDTRARFRVSEIETTVDANGAIRRTKQSISYNSKGEVEEVETKTEGELEKRLTLTYENGRIVESETVYPDDDSLELEFEYSGNLLTEMKGEFGQLSVKGDFSYFNNNARLLDEVVLEYSTDGVRSEGEQKFGYDDRSRVTSLEITQTVSGNAVQSSTTSTEMDFRYAESGDLERVQITQDNGAQSSTQEVSFQFDERGRLEEAEDEDNDYTYSVKYDDKGRIVEIERLGGGSKVTTEYTYEDGTAQGYAFEPDVPGGFMLDLAGRTHGYVEVFSSLYF